MSRGSLYGQGSQGQIEGLKVRLLRGVVLRLGLILCEVIQVDDRHFLEPRSLCRLEPPMALYNQILRPPHLWGRRSHILAVRACAHTTIPFPGKPALPSEPVYYFQLSFQRLLCFMRVCGLRSVGTVLV